MAGDRRQGWAIFGGDVALFLVGFALAWWAELQPNPVTGLAASMEGKEMRFGVMNTCSSPPPPPTPRTARSTRCTTALTPLGGLVDDRRT